jgi:hypothetical protein
MAPRLIEASWTGGYRILVAFDDGTRGEVDLEAELWGEMFEPLRNPEKFRAFRLDPELRTIVWPNGADLAPEFLYEQARA